MSTEIVFLLGNGFSIGLDDRYLIANLTERVEGKLAQLGLGSLLTELSDAFAPETPTGKAVQGFEHIAGAVDRASLVLAALSSFPGNATGSLAQLLSKLDAELRRMVVRITGAALAAVDEVSQTLPSGLTNDTRRDRLVAFGDRLWNLHRRGHRVSVYTLNYDTLLEQALLESHARRHGGFVPVYDGFPGVSLDVPLDRWEGRVGLYHLHGSVTWYADNGQVQKRTAQSMRGEATLHGWSMSHTTQAGLPAVVLGDRKEHVSLGHPFALFYEELVGDLRRASKLVVGGYGFGDFPVNSRLGAAMRDNAVLQMQIWSPAASATAPDSIKRVEQAAQLQASIASRVQPVDTSLPDGPLVPQAFTHL